MISEESSIDSDDVNDQGGRPSTFYREAQKKSGAKEFTSVKKSKRQHSSLKVTVLEDN